jgi:hypothetical protein
MLSALKKILTLMALVTVVAGIQSSPTTSFAATSTPSLIAAPTVPTAMTTGTIYKASLGKWKNASSITSRWMSCTKPVSKASPVKPSQCTYTQIRSASIQVTDDYVGKFLLVEVVAKNGTKTKPTYSKSTTRAISRPAQEPLKGSVIHIADVAPKMCQIKLDEVFCSGSDIDTATEFELADSYSALRIPGTKGALSVQVGSTGTCSLLISRVVRCWGGDWRGGFFGGAKNDRSGVQPVAIPLPQDVEQIATGNTYVCAVLADQTVWCWGNLVMEPKQVFGLSDVTYLTAGYRTACAVHSAGRVSCWDMTFKIFAPDEWPKPTLVPNLDDVIQVSVSSSNACATSRAGLVYCWGENGSGQLGNGSRSRSQTPVQAIGLTGIIQVSVNSNLGNACALNKYGYVFCWGDNTFGQLATGKLGGYSSRPLQVSKLPAIKQLQVGYGLVGAISTEGNVYTWGRDSVNVFEFNLRPVKVNTNY